MECKLEKELEMKGRRFSMVVGALFLALTVAVLPLVGACAPEEVAPPEEEAPPAPAPAPERQVITIRYAAGHPEAAGMWVRATRWFGEEFAKRVKEQTTEYEIKSEYLFGGAVCTVGETLETVQSRAVEAGMICMVFEQSKMQLQNYTWWLPFSSPDTVQVMRAADLTMEQFPILNDMMEEEYNLKVVARTSNETYNLITNFPVKTLEDLKGHKIAHGGTMVPWIDALGAVGVQSPLTEAYTCIDTGVYDGWLMFDDGIYGFKLYEPAPYYTKIDLGAVDGNWLVMNLDFWNKLPKELQKIALEVGEDTKWWQCEEAKAEGIEDVKEMRELGTHYYELPQEERARWAKVLSDAEVCDAMAKKADANGLPGTEVIRAYINNLEEVGYELPWRPEIK